MFKLLETIFIKRKLNKETDTFKKRAILGKFTTTLGMILNVVLSLIKIVLGFLTSMISIIADGINNLTDSATSIVSLIGFKISAEPADKDHPFGHQRIEYISGMLVALLALVTGFILLKESIVDIVSKEGMDFDKFNYMVIVLSVSILIKLWMALFYKNVSKRINSITLKAQSFDSFNDCFATLSILITLIISKLFNLSNIPLDGMLGIALSIFIIYNGIKLVKEAMNPLLGEAPNEDEINKINDKILSYDGVIGLHDLVIHSYGPQSRYITCHVEVRHDMKLVDAHELVDGIERDFKHDFGFDLTIHVDPVNLYDEDTIRFKEEISNIIDSINKEHNVLISFHDFRLINNSDNIRIEFDCVNPYESNIKDDKIVKMIEDRFDNKITSKRINFVINIDKEKVL